MVKLWKYNKFSIILTFVCALFYYSFAYQLERTDYSKMFGLWIGLFFLSYKIIKINPNNTKFLAGVALGFRIVFLLAVPNLSQDFYRFIWDGRILLEGLNPYLSLPETWIIQGNAPIAQANELYEGMGVLNGSHYTNYPPVSQFCYLIAGIFAGKSIIGSAVVMRLLIILADIGTFIYGRKLLQMLHIPKDRIFWYILNPFVIIELTGNLHFEAVMIFFIIWSLYLLQKGYWHWAAIALALSVSVKLIPLLFLPLFFQKFIIGFDHISLKNRLLKLIGFYSIIILITILLFAPFLSSEFIFNFSKTIGLWFQNFEFNASVYYIIRWIGYQTIGWNIIGTVGKILPMIVIGILLLLTFFRKNNTTTELITVMVIGISSYYFLSTTVHPWYLAVPLVLCVFTNYRFPIWWSFAIILSYTAYIHPDFKENLWFVALEYSIVFGIFIFEVSKFTKITSLKSIYFEH